MSLINRQELLDHYQTPRNTGKPAHYDHSFSLKNKSCGDEIEVYLTFKEGRVDSISYEARGCGLAIATASMLSDELIGLTLAELDAFSQAELEELVGKLTLTRGKCALLSLEAIKKAALAENGVD